MCFVSLHSLSESFVSLPILIPQSVRLAVWAFSFTPKTLWLQLKFKIFVIFSTGCKEGFDEMQRIAKSFNSAISSERKKKTICTETNMYCNRLSFLCFCFWLSSSKRISHLQSRVIEHEHANARTQTHLLHLPYAFDFRAAVYLRTRFCFFFFFGEHKNKVMCHLQFVSSCVSAGERVTISINAAKPNEWNEKKNKRKNTHYFIYTFHTIQWSPLWSYWIALPTH